MVRITLIYDIFFPFSCVKSFNVSILYLFYYKMFFILKLIEPL